MADTPVPVRVAYFCKTRWGAHAEFVEFFTRVCLSPRTPTILPSCGVSVPRGRVRPVLARAQRLQDDRVTRADPGLPSDPPENRTRE